jgi:hypothetical protein
LLYWKLACEFVNVITFPFFICPEHLFFQHCKIQLNSETRLNGDFLSVSPSMSKHGCWACYFHCLCPIINNRYFIHGGYCV